MLPRAVACVASKQQCSTPVRSSGRAAAIRAKQERGGGERYSGRYVSAYLVAETKVPDEPVEVAW